MQTVSDRAHPPKSTITMLTIIDLNPSDYSCIYSVLFYVIEQSRKLGIDVACVTYDQPLYFKAMDIITSKSINVICSLGGFHTFMSFLGSIGDLMEGSGLEEALQRVYWENAVEHMMTGKAIARSLRGHILVDAALHMLLLKDMFPTNTKQTPFTITEDEVDSNSDGDDLTDEYETLSGGDPDQLAECDVDELQGLRNKLMTENVAEDVIQGTESLAKVQLALDSKKKEPCANSRTATLWLMYSNYIDIVQQFTRAEKTSDWEMHLTVIAKMLNLFAETGHIHYTKSARLYLQTMESLPKKHPWLYE